MKACCQVNQKIVLWLRSTVPHPDQAAALALADRVILTVGSEELFFGGQGVIRTAVSNMVAASGITDRFHCIEYRGIHCHETLACVQGVAALIESTFGL